MKTKNFVTPHCHPQSFDSGSSPELIAQREVELETGYITVTDHGTLEAIRQTYDLTKKKYTSLKIIPGIEAYFRDDACDLLLSSGYKPDPKTGYREHIKYNHVTMHAQDEEAFFAITKLLSKADLRAEAHGSERKPLFGWEQLQEIGQHNVTMCSSCLIGMCSRHILDHNDFETAEKYFQRMMQITKPGNFYVEIFPHVCDDNFDSAIYAISEAGETRFRKKKKIKTTLGEIYIEDLAKEFQKDAAAARKKHVKIIEVSNWRKWEALPAPVELVNVEKREGFLKNPCLPWSPDGDVQTGVNKFMLTMAEKYKVPILLSDDSHFARAEDKVVQDIRLAQMGDWRFSNSHYRFTTEEAWSYINNTLKIDRKTFDSWVDNSYEWASKFDNFKFSSRKTLPTKFYPQDTLTHTMSLIKKHGRMKWQDPVWKKRLKDEIDLLYSNGTVDLLPYFMVIEEVCDLYARNGELTGAGRGSAAGLLVSYLLGITHVDPIKHKLSKERFLTLDRIQSGKMPDIDQDLGSRDLLVDEKDPEKGWLVQRFGDHVAQISTNNTSKLKMSIKDVFRALLGAVPSEIEELTKKLPTAPQGVPDKEFIFGYSTSEGHVPGIIENNKPLQKFVEKYPKEWELTQKVMGLFRGKGRHAAGYVISDDPIDSFIPMATVGGVRVTSYDSKGVEAMGALKMDFLVIDVLRKIQGALKLVQDNYPSGVEWSKLRPSVTNPVPAGQEAPSCLIDGAKVPWLQVVPHKGVFYDIWSLPQDEAVFRDICEGKVETVFQFDAAAARQGLKHFRPTDGKLPLASIDDLATFTALDRPGPLDAMVGEGTGHNMLVEFARRAAGKPPTGSLPILDEMLPETRGVIVFQEQLQYIYQEVGGTTAIEANSFRDDIGKKRMLELPKHEAKFMAGAVPKLGAEAAAKLWSMLYTFGQYGFNASHAVSYMYAAYACAWLKHYYPLEWWTSVLSNAKKEDVTGKFWPYISDKILMPDISSSKEDFAIEGDKIRAPLSLMKGLGAKAHAQLLELAPFESVEDLFLKINKWKKDNLRTVVSKKTGESSRKDGISAINSTVLKNLAIVGCMDSILCDKETLDLADKLKKLAVGLSFGKKKVTPIHPPAIAPIELYQFRKSLLPAYQDNLRQLAADHVPSRITKAEKFFWTINKDKKLDARVVTGAAYLQMANTEMVARTINVAIVGYVAEQSFINYSKTDENGTIEQRQACKLLVDLDGEMVEFVKWPSGGTLDVMYQEPLEGAVVLLSLTRRELGDTFFLNGLEIVVPPFKKKEEEPDESETSPG